MQWIKAVEDPRTRPARSWVFDVLVALLVGFLSTNYLVHPGSIPLLLGLSVTVTQALLVIGRRVWPDVVFAGVVTIAAGAALWDVRVAGAPIVLLALYTVASRQPWRHVVVVTTVLQIAIVTGSVISEGWSWWYPWIFLSGLVAAAVGLGLYAATRRAYLLELHDRAERLERERDQQSELAAAAERARIAGEMHDIVAHHLAVIIALSDGAAAASASSPERASEVMRTVSETGRRALADTRRLLGVLSDHGETGETAGDTEHDRETVGGDPIRGRETRRPLPDLTGLDALLAGVRTAGLPVSYEVQGKAGDVSTGAQLAVYRLIQEALTNTLKHAGTGASAAVRLDYRPGEIRVDVEDDGAGRSAPASTTPGRGLTGMRERMHAYGGDVVCGPRDPSGWRVSAHLRVDDRVPPHTRSSPAAGRPR